MKFFRFFLFFSLISYSSFAQGPKSFTEDPVKFLEELTDFFETANKKEGREFIEEFTPVWNQKLNDSQKKSIYQISNLMLKKRLKPFPEFRNYLGSIVNFTTSGQSDKSFQAWQAIVEKTVNGKTIRSFTDFLAMSANLFASNTFYKSASTEWKSDNSNYSFEYDSVPKVIFPSLNVKCYSKGDSAVIYNTKGVYYPTITRFYGQGGKVNWLRAGIDEATSYAQLKKYTINTKSSEYTADSVTYYNKKYFQKPLIGVLQEKVLADMTGDRASYPRFDSYNKQFQINNIAEGVDYSGGITIIGAKLQGSGTKEQNATLTFKRNDSIFLVASSKSYIIRPDKITSDRASIVMYYEDDSIFHPGLQLKFLVKEKELNLYRDEQGISKSPYFNTFHSVDMYFEALYWKLDEPKIEMKMLIGSSQSFANFESSNYFRDIRFSKLQGLDEMHPLARIRNFAKSINSQEFYVDDLASYMRLSVDQVRPLLLKLATGGFLIYDMDEEKVTVKERLYTYLYAKGGKVDYDVIDFNSTITKEANASLNLLNFDMTIRGCPEIFLSDSQNVVVYPKNQEIVLKKNRNFSFDGRVNAGLFEFFGKEFVFEYSNFKLNFANIDSMRIKVRSREKNENGEYGLVRVKNVLENLSGDLLIDKSNNKSGVQNFPEYPVFTSRKGSFVYYDKKTTQNGVYTRDKFYFQVNPFSLDSLDNFTTEGLTFNGRFASAGIFPDFDEKLSVQEDYSLGFIRATPPEGYPMYGGKGNFTDKIKLSNAGLKGDGTLKYVTSTSRSDDFNFYPDSMNAIVQTYDVRGQAGSPEFPAVKARNVYTHWLPKKDVMNTSKIDKALAFYDGQAEMNGTVYLSPGGLTGRGRMDFAKSELESNLMKFSNSYFDADTADFRLLSLNMGEMAFATNNVNARIDFKARTGDFKSNGGGSLVQFPVNQYICFMDQFKWFMDKGDIELSADGRKDISSNADSDVDLTGSEFISTHKDQDSLSFFSPKAKYDTRNNIIYARDVKYINVADARIFPDSGNVVIHKKARLDPLKRSKILANTITKFHEMYNSTVEIFGKKSYAGSADYDYTDRLKRKQTVHFTNVAVDTVGQTYAEGEVADSLSFTLSPNFEFKGKVKLLSSLQYLTFTGATRIQHNCEAIGKSWLKFSAEINPEEIMIPVEKPLVDVNNDKIAAATILTTDSTHVYSTFLSRRENYSDSDVISSSGFLYFDNASQEYRISNKEKLKEISLPGDYYALNVSGCSIYGEGKINLGGNLGQIKMNSVGNVKHNLITDSVKFDLLSSLDFFFEESLIKGIAEAIEAEPGLTAVNLTRPTYERGLRELLGKEEADKLISQLSLYGSFKKFPSELEHTFTFNDLKMKWNTATKSYVSEGLIGIGSINKTQLNKYVQGRIELVKKRSGDVLNMYLALNDNTWYFFNYQTGLMQAISSDEAFNTAIKELKPDKRQQKTEKGEANYQFILSTGRKKADFLKKFDAAEKSEAEESE